MIEMITQLWTLGPGHYIDTHPAFWPAFWLSLCLTSQACGVPLLAWSAALLIEKPLDRMVARWRARRGRTHDA